MSFLTDWQNNPLSHNWQTMSEEERKEVRARLSPVMYQDLVDFRKLFKADILEIKP